MTGSDVTELLEHFEHATATVGVSVASGFRFAPEQGLRNLPPDWPATHARYLATDPSPGWLDRNGPYGVYSVVRQASGSAWERDPLVRAFTKAGFRDNAITRVGRPNQWVYLAAYRPKPLAPYDDIALTRIRALLPWMDMAFAQTVAQQALAVTRDESEKLALRRIGAYLLLGQHDDDVLWSKGALALFGDLYEGFGARGRHRVERAVRRAYALVLEGRGTRIVHLRTDLSFELSLLPRPNADALLLASFTKQASVDDDEPAAPYEELLSPRQQLIARRLVRGDSIPAIATSLDMSAEAVKSHVREIYRRLGIATRVELATLAERSTLRS